MFIRVCVVTGAWQFEILDPVPIKSIQIFNSGRARRLCEDTLPSHALTVLNKSSYVGPCLLQAAVGNTTANQVRSNVLFGATQEQ